VTDTGQTACTLLLDLSSSMSGDQIRLCRQLALLFAETLSVLSFPTEIIGFSTVDRDLRSEVSQQTGEDMEKLARRFTRMVPLYHAVFKTFDEPWRRAAGRLRHVECKALTPLGESLLFAGRRLAGRPGDLRSRLPGRKEALCGGDRAGRGRHPGGMCEAHIPPTCRDP